MPCLTLIWKISKKEKSIFRIFNQEPVDWLSSTELECTHSFLKMTLECSRLMISLANSLMPCQWHQHILEINKGENLSADQDSQLWRIQELGILVLQIIVSNLKISLEFLTTRIILARQDQVRPTHFTYKLRAATTDFSSQVIGIQIWMEKQALRVILEILQLTEKRCPQPLSPCSSLKSRMGIRKARLSTQLESLCHLKD